MTINLEQDLESRLRRYPQILERLPDLLAEQVELEEWREKRYSAEAREIVADVLAEPVDPDEASPPRDFKRLEKAFRRMAPYLEDGDEGGP